MIWWLMTERASHSYYMEQISGVFFFSRQLSAHVSSHLYLTSLCLLCVWFLWNGKVGLSLSLCHSVSVQHSLEPYCFFAPPIFFYSCSTVLSSSTLLSLLFLSSLRALRWASCSPDAGGAAGCDSPAGVCSSGCGWGHGPPPASLLLPLAPLQDLAGVWSGAPRVSLRSATVVPAFSSSF